MRGRVRSILGLDHLSPKEYTKIWRSKYQKKYYKKNRKRIRMRDAYRYKNNPTVKEKTLIRAKEWYKKNRKHCVLMHREWELRQSGWTLKTYQLVYATQKGKCAICLRSMKVLCADHNHATGTARGLLCRDCNRALGLFKDDLNLLHSACTYLKRWS